MHDNITDTGNLGTGCSCKGIRTCLACEVDKCKSELSSQRKCDFYLYNEISQEAELCESTSLCKSFKFPGVYIIDDFISASEEAYLVKNIDANPWKPSQSGRYKQDYGPKVNFKKQKCKLASFTGLPPYSRFVVERMRSTVKLQDFQTVEVCNLDYAPERGSSIDPHFDDDWLWGERLVTLNMLSNSFLTMTWGLESATSESKKYLESSGVNLTNVAVKIPLRRRSLVILFGPARYHWKHSILRSDIVSRRVCCTFRELTETFLAGEKRDQGSILLNVANSFLGNVVL